MWLRTPNPSRVKDAVSTHLPSLERFGQTASLQDPVAFHNPEQCSLQSSLKLGAFDWLGHVSPLLGSREYVDKPAPLDREFAPHPPAFEILHRTVLLLPSLAKLEASSS